jgi:squalene-hopene/tetraprenyl-beta-curcumene cyclase
VNGATTTAEARPLPAASQRDPLGLDPAIDRATAALLDKQRPDGHWVGELQGDTILESEYILLMAFLGREGSEVCARAARYILQHQLPHGGWSNYPDGPLELSVSVKAYFALKLTGHKPDAPYMVRAREAIRAGGGASAVNSFTRFYLALLGQFPYKSCPSVPVELVLLPRWFYINLYAMSSWTRTIVVPLSIFSACKPKRSLPPFLGIRELFLDDPDAKRWPAPPKKGVFSWTNFFLGLDWLYKKAERWGLLWPWRGWAMKKAAAWIRERFTESDGLGAIFPPMIYTVIVLKCLGVAEDAPEFRWALKQLEDLIIEENDTIRLQPCLSPIWDTALVLNALAETSLGGDAPAITKAVQWLRDKEVRRKGDWSVTNPRLEPGGWFFEYANAFYPDVDDTAMVLMGLGRLGHAHRPENAAMVERARKWLLGMQNRDGGWAAFDRDINREVLTKVPFADHNAMLDPSCPDITARVLESLGALGSIKDEPVVQKALEFLRKTQDPRGCWPGRWGVNYLYGTWQVLVGLQAAGVDMQCDPMVRRAVRWLEQVQQPGGAWGESCKSYDDPSTAGQGEPTASQTAWAVMGLLAAGEIDNPATRAGIAFLCSTQQPDGTWHEEPFTGTGFPKVFYLKYHLYAHYFPLMALARARKASMGRQSLEC